MMPQCKIVWFCFDVDVAHHKTFITDRGPPTFSDGILPKQVISSGTHIITYHITNVYTYNYVYTYRILYMYNHYICITYI